MSPASGPRVVCAGILVSDLFVPPLAELPPAGQLVSIAPPLYQAGGCAANTGIDLARLGVRVGVCGTVGSDSLGAQVIEELDAAGVDVSGVHRIGQRATSQTVVLSIVGQDRRFLHSFGANAELTTEMIRAATHDADIVVIGGYLLLPGLAPEPLTQLVRELAAAGVAVLLDVAVPQGSADAQTRVRPLLPHVSAFLPNDDEARLITGRDDPVEQARTLRDWGCARTFVTCGSGGTVYADADSLVCVEPLPIDVVDGSGAGDAFTAGVVVGMLRNWSMADTLRYAAALGASVCRGLGCQSTLFTDAEAQTTMASVAIREVAGRRDGAAAQDAAG